MGVLPLVVTCFLLGYAAAKSDLDWHEHATIYQIYPRSFQDSDGDGIGDIKGIISRLDYIVELGVDAVWISSLYHSGGYDFGNDIVDFKAIDPVFGTFEDFKNLTALLHEKGIKLIMDFIPNHTSDKHPWFQAAINGDERHKKYYVWKKTPNNWLSFVGGSAWEKHPKGSNEYYLHQFFKCQPDLNFNNPDVINEMMDILDFWLYYNVDGFRIDAASALMEDPNFTNEKLKPNCNDENDYNCYYHEFTADYESTYIVLAQFRAKLDSWTNKDNVTRLMVTESFTDIWDKVLKYYEYPTKKAVLKVAHYPYNFFPITTMTKESTATDWARMINLWHSQTKGHVSNWVLGNHDQKRVGSRLGKDLIDGLNMMILMLDGTAFTYYGEEIGLLDSIVKIEHDQDHLGKMYPDQFQVKSRDFQRGPMPWNETLDGFTSNETSWLPMTQDAWELNVKVQNSSDSNSTHLHIYKAMTKLRKAYTMKYGGCDVTTVNDDILVIYRWLQDNPTIIGVMNMGNKQQNFNLEKDRNSLPSKLYLYAQSNNNMPQAEYGEYVNTTDITLQPGAAKVFLSQELTIPIKMDDKNVLYLKDK